MWQRLLGEGALKDTAMRIGLDTKRLKKCLDSGAGLETVKADERDGIELRLTGTPSTFVDGRFVNGTMPLYRWKLLIDDELRRMAP